METTLEPLKIGDRAPNITLRTQQGDLVALADIWQTAPTLFTFSRHFGCPACRLRYAELENAKERLQQAGLQIVAIGMGTPTRTAELVAELGLTFPMLADPRREAYVAFHLLKINWRGELRELNPLRALKAATQGGNVPPSGQDVMQLGGTFVVDTDGIVRFAHTNASIYGDPDVEAILRAVTQGA